LIVFAVLCVPAAGLIVWGFAPFWATPIAMWWYKPGFEEAVASALDRLPGKAGACIYDDQTNIFVTSPSELSVDKMIASAVRDQTPDLSMNRRQRDPHFRVYSGGATYYWSFKESALIRFEGDRWTLRDTGPGLCEDYKAWPAEYEQVFRERIGRAVTEANFCCDTGQRVSR
jgi:hypothetical protein